jgi:hypothetical protein
MDLSGTGIDVKLKERKKDNSLISPNFKIPTFYMTLGQLCDCMTRVLPVGNVLIKRQLRG